MAIDNCAIHDLLLVYYVKDTGIEFVAVIKEEEGVEETDNEDDSSEQC